MGRIRELMDRIIGSHIGKIPGPLLVVIGAIHGNEPAGVKAIDLVLKMLEVEPIVNEGFEYKGTLLGIIGNLKAYENGKRFINKDLNRCWTKEFLKGDELPALEDERMELTEILKIIKDALSQYKATELVLLDLHTTSSDGGIFSIVNEDAKSLEIAKQMFAPVILGMLKGLKGTSLHYFNQENLGIETSAITFESGQHDDPLSVNRAVAGIINCMRTIGAVATTDVEHQHDKILLKYSLGLPTVSSLLYSHRIEAEDNFQMKDGYKNFQKVQQGEALAINNGQEIKCKTDGRILMPLYQKQGEDGFFIIKEMDENK